jgi:hypothetical protein
VQDRAALPSREAPPFALMPSTVIRRFTYRPELEALDVEFVSGRVYRYKAVPAAVAAELAAFRAKGIGFNRLIRNRFACVRLPGWEDPPEGIAAET